MSIVPDILSHTIVESNKPFRKIRIDTTGFRTAFETCQNCGTKDSILSGLPKALDVSIPMTSEEYYFLAGNHLFWIAGDFETVCNDGLSHTAIGMNNPPRWRISSHADLEKGLLVEGIGFEQTLADFIPLFVEWLKDGRQLRKVQRNIDNSSSRDSRLKNILWPLLPHHTQK